MRDASAILALLQQEPGAENLTYDILLVAIASTVHLAEAQTKLVKRGIPADQAWTNVLSTVTAQEVFSSEQAQIAVSLIPETQSYGLSLGDRSCLALAISLNAPVDTTEQLWRNLNVGIPIHVIR